MKIAISSTGKDINSNVSDVFGRCPYFVIAEIRDKKIINVEVMQNISVKQMSRVGISVAQTIAEKDVATIITGNIGPRAWDVLKQFSIEVYLGSGPIKEVLQKFMDHKLEKVQ